jgi:sugar/nucleoside kinase (ribokinase family)
MAAVGIKPLLSTGTIGTGRAISLVSPDGERTFGTYLGSAIELSADIADPLTFKGFDHLHLEGYLVPNQPLVENALRIAANAGMTLSVDLASYNVVESNLEFLKRIIKMYKPVVFANEEEARAFSGFSEPEKALAYISQFTSTAVVKIGARGSLIFHEGKNYSADAIKVKCLDTTGAGDLYAAGYIYGFVNKMSPDQCGRIGSLLAGKVIEEAGAKISEKSWQFIGEALAEI